MVGLVDYVLIMLAFTFSGEVWAIVAARTLQGAASAFVWLAAL